MQEKNKTLSTRLRVTCYTTFLSAVTSGFFGIMLAGASASGSGGGQNLIDQLFSIKDVLFILSAMMAFYLIISSRLEAGRIQTTPKHYYPAFLIFSFCSLYF